MAVVSEFGRTLHGNANNGTDHGRGQAMLLLGGGLNGGRIYAGGRVWTPGPATTTA